MNTTYVVVFAIYLVFCFGICFYEARKQSQDSAGYFTGNRSIGPWPIAFSFVATLQSASLFMGSGGDIYRRGIAFSVFGTMLLTVGIVLTWIFMAKPVSHLTTKLDTITLSEMFDYRFNSKYVKLVSAVAVCIFYVPMMGSQLVAAGKLFKTVMGLPYWSGIVIVGLALTVVTAIGGFRGVVYNDFFQGIIMYGIFFLLVPIMLTKVGGLTEMNVRLAAEFPELLSIRGAKGYFTPLMMISWAVYFLFGLNFAQPSILVRYIGTKDPEVIKRAFPLTITCHAFSLTCITIVMMAANLLMPGMTDKETVFPTVMTTYLPPVVAGLALCAVFACMMSTVDSLLLVASSAFAQDIVKGFVKKDLSDKGVYKLGMLASLVLGLLAVWVAMYHSDGGVLKLTVYASGAMIPIFLFPVLGITLFKRLNTVGVLSGMIIGCAFTIAFELTVGWTYCVPALPAVVVTTVVTLVVTYLTPPPPREVTDVFFGDAPREVLDEYRKKTGVTKD